jgi:hypothetical protein
MVNNDWQIYDWTDLNPNSPTYGKTQTGGIGGQSPASQAPSPTSPTYYYTPPAEVSGIPQTPEDFNNPAFSDPFGAGPGSLPTYYYYY